MTKKKERQKLIPKLKDSTGLPFIVRAKLAKALLRSDLYPSEFVKIIEKDTDIIAEESSYGLDCDCCTISTVSYYVKDKYFYFAARYGSFEVRELTKEF
jgi:hypothetical protein